MSAPAQRITRARTLLGDIGRSARNIADASEDRFRGFAQYRNDPVGYARDVLGCDVWERQADILRAIGTRDRVVVRSGHGVGKSTSAGAAASWFRATRGAGSRVVMTAPTARQVDEVLWREYRRLHHNARIRLGGEIATLARTGHRDLDGRQVFGVTAESPESFAGIRAPEMMIIVDEASGVAPEIFDALLGNLAGGGIFLLLGNPTKANGFFFDAFKSDRFEKLVISSLESPNVVAGCEVVPGLVNHEWVEERRAEWGEDSAEFKIRVLGEFVENAEGRMFSPAMIADAERRWSDTPASGRVVIGLDPAGEMGTGDESAFCVRRGKKIVALYTRSALTPEAHLIEIQGLLRVHRGSERPCVVVDRDGLVGARVFGTLGAHAEKNDFQLVGVRSGERAQRKPDAIDRVRDELWYSLADAFRDGLAIPEDLKLEAELALMRATTHISGRSKITPKDEIRKVLSRSSDRADALALCCWHVADYGAVGEVHRERDAFTDGSSAAEVFDPYVDFGSHRETFDPYGGR